MRSVARKASEIKIGRRDEYAVFSPISTFRGIIGGQRGVDKMAIPPSRHAGGK